MSGDRLAREGFDLAFRISGHALAHSVVLLSVPLLLLNDHLLKARFPSFWTGKLSDFAGLFFFPFLVIPALALALGPLRLSPSRLADLGFGLTALSFAALKFSPPLNAAIATIVSALLGRPAVFALDPSDGIALIALIPSRWLWKRTARKVQVGQDAPPRWAWVAWILAMIASLATPPCPPELLVRRILVWRDHVYAGLTSVGSGHPTWVVSADGGETWQRMEGLPLWLQQEPVTLDWPIVRCRADQPSVCYRIPGPGRVEASTDGGQTWRTAWAPPWGRESFRKRLLSMFPIGCMKQIIDEGPYDLTFDPEGNRWLVALGTEGILILSPDRPWRIQDIQISGFGGFHITHTPYAAENLVGAAQITMTESYATVALALLFYQVQSYRAIARLRSAIGSAVRFSAPTPRRRSRAWIIFLIGIGLPIAIFFLSGLSMGLLPERTLEAIAPVFLKLIFLVLFILLSSGPPFLPLNTISLLLIIVSIILIWRLRRKWRALRESAPRPEAIRAVHREIVLAALGISPGAWAPFVAWAMGWIPLYEMALVGAILIAVSATIGSALRIRRWQKLLQSTNEPPKG
ncbi:beta propeller repeat protein [Thermoflexus hugenholtzii]|uniref:Uncharacterized protein n=1 Tax=Thermoflexus hugenholtzii JAD2 TaxID=877466 RepID=A0A212RQU0_9CHLR|nr:sialidase family protein [Thermoflexus hugenholtzii]SNB74894.1 hypothetical protein SAMN02746019_00018260 [Thermoflexus hugenholtzii JAD2]